MFLLPLVFNKEDLVLYLEWELLQILDVELQLLLMKPRKRLWLLKHSNRCHTWSLSKGWWQALWRAVVSKWSLPFWGWPRSWWDWKISDALKLLTHEKCVHNCHHLISTNIFDRKLGVYTEDFFSPESSVIFFLNLTNNIFEPNCSAR